MRKRLLILLVCLVSMLLAGYVMLWLTTPRHRITLDAIEAIDVGMTEKEVEVILGAPAGNYSSLNSVEAAELLGCYDKPGDKRWVSEKLCVGVRFDATGKVTTFDWYHYHNNSFLAKLRRWRGIQ